jgi:spermidine synthase
MSRTTVPAATAPVLPNSLRAFLYVTAAITGAAIMIVEILGAKMLSPYIGTSHFVWTAQIAVTLVALACGYYAGGKLADRSQQVHRLYWAIFAAAVYLALTLLVIERVAYWSLDLNLALGSLVASAILFFVPLGLLAMTGPFLVRVVTSSIAGVGGNVGRLTAISTLGSFAGTLLIGYVLIPFLPNSVTMYLTALLLMMVAAVFFLFFRRKAALRLAIIIGSALLAGLPLRSAQNHDYRLVVERFRGNSHFGELQVLDRRDSPIRYLLNDNLVQNAYDLERKQSPLSFSYMLAGLPEAYTEKIEDVLVIGMGIGIVPMDFARRGARVDTVEINPSIIPIATRFFDFKNEMLQVTIGDGRHFLNRTKKKYDVIILDAFVGDSFPSHLMTRETFESVRNLLQPGGTVVVHTFGDLESGRDYLLGCLDKTMRKVFSSLRVHTSGEGAFFFVAKSEPHPEFKSRLNLNEVHPGARQEVATAFAGAIADLPDTGRVLTDNYNPADFFDAHNRELLRRRLALTARNM